MMEKLIDSPVWFIWQNEQLFCNSFDVFPDVKAMLAAFEDK